MYSEIIIRMGNENGIFKLENCILIYFLFGVCVDFFNIFFFFLGI